MLTPTNEEKQAAEELDLDYEGMNGPQIREAIRLAQARQSGQKQAPLAKTPLQAAHHYAQKLGLPVSKHVDLEVLQVAVALKLEGILAEKGITDGKRIRFTLLSDKTKILTAKVLRTRVSWSGASPHIILHRDGLKGSGTWNPYYLLTGYEIEVIE